MEAYRKKIAIVTGGSRGIGRGIVEALLRAGWRVRFCSRNPRSVEEARRELSEAFGDAVAGRAVDVRSQEEVDRFVEETLRDEGRIDCLVNNAGVGTFGPVDELTGEQWREVIETNLSGCFYFLHAVAPAMKRQGDGWIFNISSLAGKNPTAGAAAGSSTSPPWRARTPWPAAPPTTPASSASSVSPRPPCSTCASTACA